MQQNNLRKKKDLATFLKGKIAEKKFLRLQSRWKQKIVIKLVIVQRRIGAFWCWETPGNERALWETSEFRVPRVVGSLFNSILSEKKYLLIEHNYHCKLL